MNKNHNTGEIEAGNDSAALGYNYKVISNSVVRNKYQTQISNNRFGIGSR
jgi:hypothetical protein